MSNTKKDFKFDKRAEKYDAGFEGRVSKKFYDLLLREVKLNPNDAVLDVGCGTGAFLYALAQKTPIHGSGIDVEPNMIIEAQKKCPNMNLQLSGGEATTFESNSFDAMTACMAYHHFSDKEGFKKEASRLLKQGGMLYIADPKFPFIIRKAINGASRLLNFAGHFSTADELALGFKKYGFSYVDSSAYGFAQVVILQKD